MKKVIAYGYPRLHWSLVDMAAASRRMFGGFGVAINSHPVIATAEEAEKLEIETEGFIEDRTKQNLVLALYRAESKGFDIKCKIHVQSKIRQHIGFGSSTQIILTAMDAVAYQNHWGMTPEKIIEISGRGRASLIGWATHYYGGFCIDAGQPFKPDLDYLPSHTPGTRKPSVFIGNWRFPEEWKISLLGENSQLALEPNDENSFMQANTPIDKTRGMESIVELYHGILPSIIEKDYSTFTLSMNNIQQIGWNSREILLQSEMTKEALQELWSLKLAASLSSFGPLISVVHTEDATEVVENLAKKYNLSCSGPYGAINKRGSIEPLNPFIQEYIVQ